MSEQKKPNEEKKDPNGFKEFQVDVLAGRVYNDGRVKIGMLVIDSVTPGKPRLEVEMTVTSVVGRDFCEKLMGLINQQDGRY